jgi:hypothetical protein
VGTLALKNLRSGPQSAIGASIRAGDMTQQQMNFAVRDAISRVEDAIPKTVDSASLSCIELRDLDARSLSVAIDDLRIVNFRHESAYSS